MRYFVALPVPGEVAAALVAYRAQHGAGVRDVRWSVASDLHVTLQFLGELGEAQAREVAEALKDVGRPGPVEVVVEGTGTFSQAGVLLVAVRPDAALLSLVRQVGQSLRPAGCMPEMRPFRPHITLGRTRRPLAGELARQWSGEQPRLAFRQTEVGLFRARPEPASDGGRYEPVKRYLL